MGTIFWYLWSPVDFFDKTLGLYVIEVEKKDPEVELPVGGRTSGFHKNTHLASMVAYRGLRIIYQD